MMKKVGVHSPVQDVDSPAQFCANCSSPIVVVRGGGGGGGDHDHGKYFNNKYPKKIQQMMMMVQEIPVNIVVGQGKTKKSFMEVKSALSTLYNLQFLNDLPATIFCSDDEEEEEEEGYQNKNKKGAKFGQSEKEVVGVCSKCSHVLQNLWKYYGEFEELRQVDSYVERRIRKWNKILQQLLITLTEMMTTTTTTMATEDNGQKNVYQGEEEGDVKNEEENKVINKHEENNVKIVNPENNVQNNCPEMDEKNINEENTEKNDHEVIKDKINDEETEDKITNEENTEMVVVANVNDRELMETSDNNISCDNLPCPPVPNCEDAAVAAATTSMVDCENEETVQIKNVQQQSSSTLAANNNNNNNSGQNNIITIHKDDDDDTQKVINKNDSCGTVKNGSKKKTKLTQSSLNPFVKLSRLTTAQIKAAGHRGGERHKECEDINQKTDQVMVRVEDNHVSHHSASNNRKEENEKGNLSDTLQINCNTLGDTTTATNCNTSATTNPVSITCNSANAAVVVVDGPRDKLLCDNPNARRGSCDSNLNPVIMTSYVVDDNYFMDEGSDDLPEPSPFLNTRDDDDEEVDDDDDDDDDDDELEWRIVTDDDRDNDSKDKSKTTTSTTTTTTSKVKSKSSSSSSKSPRKSKSRSRHRGKKRKASQNCESNHVQHKKERPALLTSSNNNKNNNGQKPVVNKNNQQNKNRFRYVCSLCPCGDKQSFLVQTDLCQHFLSAHVDYNSYKSCPFSTCSHHHTESFTDLFQLTTHLATVHVSLVPNGNNNNNNVNINRNKWLRH